MRPVDLPTAKALQELGYDGECRQWYDRDGKLKPDHLVDDDTPAPRLDDAAYWLRERHGLLIYIHYLPNERIYCPAITDMIGRYCSNVFYPFDSSDYDTVLANSVELAIKIIKRTKR